MSDQITKFANHDQPIKTIHYIQTPDYSCIMTGSWDKKLKFWSPQNPNPIMTFELSEKVYCADVHYPMAVVATADKKVYVYDLTGQPKEFRQIQSKLACQVLLAFSVTIFTLFYVDEKRKDLSQQRQPTTTGFHHWQH